MLNVKLLVILKVNRGVAFMSVLKIKYGIDISEHNGIVDWNWVESSGEVDFVMLRAGYGQTSVDKHFRNNALMCNTLGIPIGIYWFSYAKTVADAEREANACLETIKDYKITYPVAFDFEDDSVRVAKNNGVYVGQGLATDMAMAFLRKIKSAGYHATLYSNPAYLVQYFEPRILENFSLWLAQWPANPNPEVRPPQQPVIWQYSAKGKIPGIRTDVDLNVSYVDYELEEAQKPESSDSVDITMPALVKSLNFEKQKSWFEKEGDETTLLELSKSLGFTDGSRPYEIASRAEVMTMVSRAYIALKANIDEQLNRIIEAMALDEDWAKQMMSDDGK